MSRATYAIRVVGEVPLDLLDNFQDVTSVAQSMETTLRAEFTDPAALHGLLNALRRADFELLEVRREIGPQPQEPPTARTDSVRRD